MSLEKSEGEIAFFVVLFYRRIERLAAASSRDSIFSSKLPRTDYRDDLHTVQRIFEWIWLGDRSSQHSLQRQYVRYANTARRSIVIIATRPLRGSRKNVETAGRNERDARET